MMTKNCTYFDQDTIVRGELTTSDVILEGVFEGKIRASRNILLKQTGQLEADIRAKKLKVEEGAVYRGHISLLNGEE